MNVVVLGTGTADGWPNPFCTCASCTSERAVGRVRGQTAALVDGEVLLDCGPTTPDLANRAGVALAGVRHVLITHVHPDHCSPAFLLTRSWVTDAPLTVVGPSPVLAQAREWVASDSPVRFVEARVGERLDLEGGRYVVRPLRAAHEAFGDAVLYDVQGPSGRILYATDTGPLPAETLRAVAGAAYDVVLLEETFGDHLAHGTAHLDLSTFPAQLRLLREHGAVTGSTEVVAVHLSHHNPPTKELARRLAAWGARVVEDGTALTGSVDPFPGPLRTLVLGGARSGKSREAERLLSGEPEVTYVATSYPGGGDPEWDERLRRHRARRPAHWRTVETVDLVPLLGSAGEPLLVDCLTLWLTRCMDAHGAWDDEVWAARGEQAVEAAVEDLLAAWRATRRRVVLVTNEVGQGVVPDTASGRRFRDLMGRLNARVAAETEDVRWCVAGRVVRL